LLILLEKLYKLNELIGFFEITFVTIALQLKGQSNNFYFLEAFYFYNLTDRMENVTSRMEKF
jgi:hypothetical protein